MRLLRKDLENDRDFSSPYIIEFPRKLKDFVTQQHYGAKSRETHFLSLPGVSRTPALRRLRRFMDALHLFQSDSDAFKLFHGMRDFARRRNLQFACGKPSNRNLIRMISNKNVSGRSQLITGSPQIDLRAEVCSAATITNEGRGRVTPIWRNQLMLDFIITGNTAGD